MGSLEDADEDASALLAELKDASWVEALRRAWSQGQARWPTLSLPFRRYAGALAPLLTGSEPPDQRLAALHVTDLYLSVACASGDPRAFELLEAEILPSIAKTVRRSASDDAERDEVLQRVRTKLLLSVEGAVPRISAYAGKGPLLNWVRAVALRELLDLQRAKHPDEPLEPSLTDALPITDEAPELDFLRREHRADFKAALNSALQALTPRERTLIRMYAVEGLRMDQLAALQRVNKSTVSRWLAKARRTLFEETRRELRERLGLSGSELDSLMRLLRSQLSLSLGRLIPPEPA